MSESDAQFFVRAHNGWTLAFDRKSLQRGLDYAEEGRSEIVSILDMTVRAQCAGSGGKTYYQRITLDMTEDGLECQGTCSCPVGEDCKHCAAALYLLERGPDYAEGSHDAPHPPVDAARHSLDLPLNSPIGSRPWKLQQSLPSLPSAKARRSITRSLTSTALARSAYPKAPVKPMAS